jgi:hypothetical protein
LIPRQARLQRPLRFLVVFNNAHHTTHAAHIRLRDRRETIDLLVRVCEKSYE